MYKVYEVKIREVHEVYAKVVAENKKDAQDKIEAFEHYTDSLITDDEHLEGQDKILKIKEVSD